MRTLCSRAVHTVSVVLILQLCVALLPHAADDALVVTVNASAHGSVAIGDAIHDQCEYSFSARLVYHPDPVTGIYENPSEEQYMMTASGAGSVPGVESWTYSAIQPGPGTVSVQYSPTQGKATVGWSYLCDYVAASPESGQGIDRMARTWCKIAEDYYEMEEESGIVHFPANATSFTATGQGRGAYTDGFSSGEFTASYTVALGAAEYEAVLVPDPVPDSTLPKYADWIPEGSVREDLPGNTYTCRVFLRRKGSSTTTADANAQAKFIFHLTDTSRQPGVCMNSPGPGAAVDTPDFQFPESSSLQVRDEGQTAETVRTDLSDQLVTVASHDYGGFTRLTVDAEVAGQGTVRAFVLDHPEQQSLPIPKDDDGNRIADAWEDQQEGLSADLPATWDEAPNPEGHFMKGDGISLYEKYRGFVCQMVYERLDPMQKYLFVYDPTGCAYLLTLPNNFGSSFPAASSGIKLRFVDEDTWTGTGTVADGKRIVNFNTNDFGHAVDQHALHVRLQTGSDPKLASEYVDVYRDKFKKDPDPMDLSRTFGLTYPDQTAAVGRMASPQDALLIEVFGSSIDAYTRETVQYNTWTEAKWAEYHAASAADQTQMEEDFARDVAAYLNDYRADVSKRYWYNLSATLSHEMGHGVGVDDLLPPNSGGPWSCLMRYFGYIDYARDPSDRLELRRRWTSEDKPTVFCNDPTATTRSLACHAQIQVTDRRASGGGSEARGSLAKARSPRAPMGPGGGGGSGSGSVVVLQTNLAAISAGAELEWVPLMAGDPLRVTVHLRSPNWLQAMNLAVRQGATNETGSPLSAMGTNWWEGVRLNLYRVAGDDTRTLVLGEQQWASFLRVLACDGGLWEPLLANRSREWMTSGAAAALSEGVYVLTVVWDGRGHLDPAWLPTNGVVAGKEVRFAVQAPTNALQQASHLRRLAYQEWDTHQDELARQHGLEAIALDPQNRSKDGVETHFVVATCNLRLKDYRGAAQTLLQMRERLPDVQRTETGYHASSYLRALVPELRITSTTGASAPRRLTILGHSGQRYGLQASSDLVQWTTLGVWDAPTNRFEVTDPDPAGTWRYYRVEWLTKP